MAWQDVRTLYRRIRLKDPASWHVESTTLEIRDEHVSELATKLALLLDKLRHADTRRVGNGMFLLLGRAGTWAHSTLC